MATKKRVPSIRGKAAKGAVKERLARARGAAGAAKGATAKIDAALKGVKTPKASKPAKTSKASKPAKKLPAIRGKGKDLLAELAVKQRLALAEAQKDVALIKARLERIRKDFYDVGQALLRLKRPPAYGALGYETFAELLDAEFGMSPATASRLVAIAEHVSRELSEGVGLTHAYELVRLMKATPEDDTTEELATKTLTLPSGERLHVPTATAREKRAATAALKEGRRSKRGKTVTSDERSMAREIEASLRALGVATATVRAKATKPGQAGHLEIGGVPFSQMKALCQAICDG